MRRFVSISQVILPAIEKNFGPIIFWEPAMCQVSIDLLLGLAHNMRIINFRCKGMQNIPKIGIG
jgi:hypothetical protein